MPQQVLLSENSSRIELKGVSYLEVFTSNYLLPQLIHLEGYECRHAGCEKT